MEATGVNNPRSTPKSRKQKRDTAVAVGELQKFVTAQPALIAVVFALILLAAWLETVSF